MSICSHLSVIIQYGTVIYLGILRLLERMNNQPRHFMVKHGRRDWINSTTLIAVAETMFPLENVSSLYIVTARVGIDDKTENKANTIVDEKTNKDKIE